MVSSMIKTDFSEMITRSGLKKGGGKGHNGMVLYFLYLYLYLNRKTNQLSANSWSIYLGVLYLHYIESKKENKKEN